MNKKLFVICLLLICIVASGCVPNRILLRRGQKDLNFKKDEGGVIFSTSVTGKHSYTPQNINVQEINQYVHFKKRKLHLIPRVLNKVRKDIYLFGLKLPKGKYRLSHFGGLKSFFQFFVPCNKIMDVSESEVSYAGRVEIDTTPKAPSVNVSDRYEEDNSMFLDTYSVLEGEKIKKDLMY